MLPQPLHELKPYSRKKPKLKYETLHDAGNEMRMFTGIRSKIGIHHEDGKGYAYVLLSQLCPKSWGNNELIRKPNLLSYYRNQVRLQAYVRGMRNKVTNEYESTCKERDKWIGE
jgi:adenine specific DNA methylase Mod